MKIFERRCVNLIRMPAAKASDVGLDSEARSVLWREICEASVQIASRCSVYAPDGSGALLRVDAFLHCPAVQTWQLVEALSLLSIILRADEVRTNSVRDTRSRARGRSDLRAQPGAHGASSQHRGIHPTEGLSTQVPNNRLNGQLIRILRSQFVEQCLGVFQIGGVEALGEPAVHFGQHRARLVATAHLCDEARKARGRAKFK
jgi:hypothetical protein